MKQNSLRNRRNTIYPTEAEDRAIRAGIAADPDTHELTRKEIQELRPFTAAQKARLRGPHTIVVESDAQWNKRARKLNANGNGIGRPPKEKPKELVTVRLDVDALAFLRSGGPGWQTRLNALVSAAAKRASKAAAGKKAKI